MTLYAKDLIREAKEQRLILYEKDAKTRIATLTINRPDHLNAVNVGMRLLYADYLHQANVDDRVKVLVLRSEGDHHGTGADLAEQFRGYSEGPNNSPLHEFRIDEDLDVQYPPQGSFRYIHQLTDLYSTAPSSCRSLQEFKKISILEVKGYCYGWHFYQAADADLVVASEDALFGHPAYRYVGWGPRMWTWAETIGLRRFMEMVFTGRPFTAREMGECGFVNSVVPRDKLEEETHKYALACSRSRPTDTVVAQKTFFELYKQYRGEYMGARMTAWLEAMWPYMHHTGDDVEFTAELMNAGVNNAVKTAEKGYPPEWRMSMSGRKGN
jgi:enoyl-CoA hydratase/carnithine racemase